MAYEPQEIRFDLDRRCMSLEAIAVKPGAGATIHAVVRAGAILALQSGADVKFNFNDKDYLIAAAPLHEAAFADYVRKNPVMT